MRKARSSPFHSVLPSLLLLFLLHGESNKIRVDAFQSVTSLTTNHLLSCQTTIKRHVGDDSRRHSSSRHLLLIPSSGFGPAELRRRRCQLNRKSELHAFPDGTDSFFSFVGNVNDKLMRTVSNAAATTTTTTTATAPLIDDSGITTTTSDFGLGEEGGGGIGFAMLQDAFQKWIEEARHVSHIISDLLPGGLDMGDAPTFYSNMLTVLNGSPLLLLSSSLSSFLELSFPIKVMITSAPIFLIVASIFYALSHPPDDFRSGFEPYDVGYYNPQMAREYYSKHSLLVVRRALQLLRISNKFIFHLLLDKYVFKDEEKQRSKRADELLTLINKAGPTAIKVGQALSVRPDLVPIEYAEALATLQDRVPPFDSKKAKDILRKEWGAETFNTKVRDLNMDQGPVASASIGQVYRGIATLKDGTEREVAVKIQRPDVLAEIALDLFLVREFAPYYQKLTGSATNFQSLANEWGRGFIAELAFTKEAASTKKFNIDMKKRSMNAVMAPVVIDEFCTDRVLVTEWVHGTRLDQSTAGDVPRLCSVALNAYLVMLLETGTLHCDPHPGNLLRTNDGRLCILDFGMTLDTDPTLQYNLLEFVAHLTSEAYDKVPEDLVKMGFLKADRLETVRASGFLEPLTYMLKQAGQGGGAEKVRERIFAEYRERFPGLTDEELRYEMRDDMKKKIEEARKKESAVSGITLEVEELQKRNRDAFRIPEWFLYTSRAFLTLEGICLQADENYSIIQSCFPYVAKRLLGDDSPRAQKALRELLYGAGDVVDVKRLSDLADGFSTYTTTTKTVNHQRRQTDSSAGLVPVNVTSIVKTSPNGQQRKRPNLADTEATITLAKESADILLSPKGNLVQNLLVNEGALAASAQAKDVLRDAIVDGPQRFRSSLPLNLGTFLPASPLERVVVPFLKKSKDEEKAQELVAKLSAFVPKPSLPSPPRIGNLNGAIAMSNARTDLNGAADLVEADRTGTGGTTLRDVDPEQVALVAKELRENLPRYAPLLRQLSGKFAYTLLERASENIDQTLSELDGEGKSSDTEISDRLVKAAAKGLSNVAGRSADVIKKQPTSSQ